MTGRRDWRVIVSAVLWIAAACIQGCATQDTIESDKRLGRRAPAQSAVARADLATIAFTIQVGAFSTAERAARYAGILQAKGLDAYYFIDADQLYKVRFDRFESKRLALRRAMALRARGIIDGYYVVKPSAGAGQIGGKGTLRRSIVKTAKRFLGLPYRWGGASAKKGFDCSGLTMTVYRLNGLHLPRNSRSQFDAGHHITKATLAPGDLVFFATGRKGRVSHVGIYTGLGRFIHASGSGRRIQTASLDSRYFRSRFMGARRYF